MYFNINTGEVKPHRLHVYKMHQMNDYSYLSIRTFIQSLLYWQFLFIYTFRSIQFCILRQEYLIDTSTKNPLPLNLRLSK